MQGCSNDSKFDAPSCNVRPVEVAKVPVETAAKGLWAFLFTGLGGAERQQKQAIVKTTKKKNNLLSPVPSVESASP